MNMSQCLKESGILLYFQHQHVHTSMDLSNNHFQNYLTQQVGKF